MASEIYLIEEIRIDSLKNYESDVLRYNALGYIQGETKAKNFCLKGKNYTNKDCLSIPKDIEIPQYRYKRLEDLLKTDLNVEEEKRKERNQLIEELEEQNPERGMESFMGSRSKF